MRKTGVIALRLAGVVFGLFAVAFQAAPTLVLYYKFEETTGTTVADSSGNNLTANWTGNTALISNSAAGDCAPTPAGNTRSLIFGKGAVETVGGYITTPNAAVTKFTGPFSVMAWIKPTQFATGQNHNDTGAILFDWVWDNPPGVFCGWGFDITVNQNLQFYTGNASAMDTMQSTGTVPWGTWSHVAAVWDGTNKFIYINGALDSTKAWSGTLGQTTNTFQVGKDDYDRNFYGNVDEVRLYNGALSGPQITDIYNGIDAPTNLAATPGPNEVTLTWSAVAQATGYNIYRSGTSGGPPADPYVKIGSVNSGTTTTYTDITAMYPNTYYYVVQAVVGALTSTYSNEASCSPLQADIIVSPTSLQVAENGGTANFTVSLTVAPTANVAIQIASAAPASLLLTAPGGAPTGSITLTFVPGGALSQQVVVTAVEQHVEGAPMVVDVNFTAVTSTDANYPPADIPPSIPVTIVEDVPALIINPPSGLSTVNGGSSITFTIALSTIPQGNVTLNLSVSDPNLATVAPLQITNAAWNNPVTVTVTPNNVNTTTTYIAPYEILIDSSTSTDPAYAALGATAVPIYTQTSTPPLSKTWGSCGLIGLEGMIPLAVLALGGRRRARRRARLGRGSGV